MASLSNSLGNIIVSTQSLVYFGHGENGVGHANPLSAVTSIGQLAPIVAVYLGQLTGNPLNQR
jgi:hypothetical protein